MLLEINYRLATDPQAGTRMKLFGIAIDAATPWPWIAAIVFLVGGGFVARRMWPRVAAAWAFASAPSSMSAERHPS